MQQNFVYTAAKVDQPALGFVAQFARITTGQFSVAVGPPGMVFPRYVTDAVIRLNPPTSTPTVTVTAPPASPTPIGPLQQTNAIVLFTDEDLSPSPGSNVNPQTVAKVTGATAGVVQFPQGLSRAFTLGFAPQSGTMNWDVFVRFNGTLYVVESGTQATPATVGFGQGTQLEPSDLIQLNVSGATVDYAATWYY